MDDVASGAVQYLATFPALTSLLGSVPLTDPNPVNHGKPYIFNNELLVTLEGTQAAAIVCSNWGGYDATELFSLRFGRLSIEIYCDTLRDVKNNATASPGATRKRTEQVFSVLQSILHRVDPAAVIWGDLVTVGCTLLSEGGARSAPDGDWMQYKQAFYGVRSSGWTDQAIV